LISVITCSEDIVVTSEIVSVVELGLERSIKMLFSSVNKVSVELGSVPFDVVDSVIVLLLVDVDGFGFKVVVATVVVGDGGGGGTFVV